MSLRLLSVVLGLTTFAFMSLSAQGRARPMADVMTFGIETYVPVKREAFANSEQVCEVTKPGALVDLLAHARLTDEPFDELRVRGLIREATDSIFVDARGTFEYHSRRYMVSEGDFRNVVKAHFSCQRPKSSKRVDLLSE